MKIFFIFYTILLFSLNLYPQEQNADSEVQPEKSEAKNQEQVDSPKKPSEQLASTKSDFVIASVGIAQRNTSWMSWPKSWERTDYDVETAKHTIIEGDIGLPKIYTKLGFNLHQDTNTFGEVKQYAGYIGFKGFNLKTERGKFAGSVFFEGDVTNEQSKTTSFNQQFFYSEITVNMSAMVPEIKNDFHYLGIRYTKWDLPSEVYLTQESQAFSVIDPEFESSFYSLILGEDSFTQTLLYDKEHWENGFSWMKSYSLGVGYGHCKVSDSAVKAAKELYNLEMTDREYPVMAGHIAGQFGPMFRLGIAGLKLAIGIGYDINFLFLGKSPFTSTAGTITSAPANDSGKADVGTFPMFLYHGPIFRIHGVF